MMMRRRLHDDDKEEENKYSIDEIDTAQGKQMKLIDISIPEKLAVTFKDKIKQDVVLKVGTYVSNGRVGYYGLEV